jgi:putative GTP pyrophosphokinase
LNTFDIIKQENTTRKLREDQFGYSSMHYVVRFPKDWLVVPAMALFGEMKAEIQVRTIAQHLWADASHILQYKNEENIPEPIKRSIHRVSAILETVDLEFESTK